MRLATLLLLATAASADEYQRRVDAVRRIPGFAALYDFVKRDAGRFAPHIAKGETHDLRLDAVNYVRDYWNEGREAVYADFPMLGRGPFGEAVRFNDEKDATFRPTLIVPRSRVHDSVLDAKGRGRSVSMAIWVIRESGIHALGGIWHEGTDLTHAKLATRVEAGRRQYAIFLGLAANRGASAAHVSENGGASFGDRFARNLSTTGATIPEVAIDAPPATLDRSWHLAAFAFDNDRNTVTSYLDGRTDELWIDKDLDRHPFFRWPYQAWTQAELASQPGQQPGEDPAFPKERYYRPPESRAIRKEVVSDSAGRRVEIHHFPFTRVRVTFDQDRVASRELLALKANPFWFPHDLFSPPGAHDGGPFTIGRVIHTTRNVGFTGYIGGVAVFDRALSARDMERLAAITRAGPIARPPEP